MIYELQNAQNDAYIDYRKAWELSPGNDYAKANVVNLAKQLGFSIDDVPNSEQDLDDGDKQKASAEVVLFYETGFAPVKQEVSVPIFGRRGKAIG